MTVTGASAQHWFLATVTARGVLFRNALEFLRVPVHKPSGW